MGDSRQERRDRRPPNPLVHLAHVRGKFVHFGDFVKLVDHANTAEQDALAQGIGFSAASHLELLVAKVSLAYCIGFVLKSWLLLVDACS